jgi:hypothetical protein
MANEVRLSCSFSYSAQGLTLSSAPSLTYSMSGVNAVADVQSIASGLSQQLNLSGVADVRFLYIKNQSTGNFPASIATNSGQTSGVFILNSGEFYIAPKQPTGIWASGVSGAVDLQYIAVES